MGELHKLLKLQGDFIATKASGAGACMYILLQSIYTYRASRTPAKGFDDQQSIKQVFIGVDPGASGAMGVVTDNGLAAVVDYTEPELWRHMIYVIGCLHATGNIFATAYVEKLHIKTGFQAKASESMVRTNGIWIGALTMADIPYAEVLPQEWQKHHHLESKTLEIEVGTEWKTMHASSRSKIRKNAHRRKAKELLPHMKFCIERSKDHDRADALLLALMAKDQMFFF